MRKLILASLCISGAVSLEAQGVQQRVTRLLEQPPFDKATWNIYAQDDRGRVLLNHNGDRLSVPASNTKLVVAATGTVLLPADYRVHTSLYAAGTVTNGVLEGDLIVYGRGDPTWSERCYSIDTLAVGAGDPRGTAVHAIADSLRARGIKRISGKIVGDGSYFEPTLTHWNWGSFDINWWYAAPVSGLGFHDNSVDFHITPGPFVDAPPVIDWNPDLQLFTFENGARTVPADSGTTTGNNFFRKPGTLDIWAEGTVAVSRTPWIERLALPDPTLYAARALVASLHKKGVWAEGRGAVSRTRWIESFALPAPNLYAARALEASLHKKGVAVEGGAASTTDSMAYRTLRCCGSPIIEYRGRPLPDIVFPILNTSQNWFAEMLLKIVAREAGDTGSWGQGLDGEKRVLIGSVADEAKAVGGGDRERRFLMNSVRVDWRAFAREDGRGVAGGNLVPPHAFVQLLSYMYKHP